MNLSILNVKKSQLKNASKDASVSTIEAPAQKPDYTGVPEAEAQAEAINEQKKAATTKARAERKVAAKKSAKAEPKPIKATAKAEVTEAVKPKPIKPSAKKEKEPTKKTTPKFTIVDYSEKCVALFGDTKPIKDELKKLGGRFNANLRPFDDDTRVPGWVFPKKCKDDLMKLIK